MATQDIVPGALVSLGNWTVGAGSNPTCVQTNDGDTSYIVNVSSTNSTAEYSLGSNTIPAGSTINSVTVSSWSDRIPLGANQLVMGLRLGGSTSEAGQFTPNRTTYTQNSAALARPGGGSWTLSDLSSTNVYIRTFSSNTPETRVTMLFVTVDYTAPAGDNPTGTDLAHQPQHQAIMAS